eukprot:gnl/MRDRNA2_/MRDRNA2_27673_c0_seq1.p1 gnl/MRDRNA2_/MRDRNA2_27673_c0~~gnl/MRDRNA2_/MRDRNA2_27673_c0_seq1.p1  ORF type:complete len:265 (+),score=25.80 gnl/MRDRNA2_/MRDRNA2_27673_c0_seq1:99-893(+)
MGSKRTFAYGTLGGFYGQELAMQADGNRALQTSFSEHHRGPQQAPLPLLGRTTNDETFSGPPLWAPTCPSTPAAVASRMYGAVQRGEDPARGAIVWDQPERLRPESLRGMADKNRSGGFSTGADLVRSSHSHEAFRGHTGSSLTSTRDNPRPPNQMALPDRGLFSSYMTSTGRDFCVANVMGATPASEGKTYIDDSSRVMGAQIPNRVRNIMFVKRSQSTGTIRSLPAIVDVMPHSAIVRKLEAAHLGKGPTSRPPTGDGNQSL